jgi:sec-independent protein translocase protein TatB
MFDFAWSEIALIGVVALIAIGPKDMPRALKAVTDVVKKARRMAGEFQTHVDDMMKDADLGQVRDHINDLRTLDIKGRILKAVDGDNTLRKAFNDDPFKSTPAQPVGPTAATASVTADASAPPVADAGTVLPAAVPPRSAAAIRSEGAPAFVPPEFVPPPAGTVPAFIPPAAARRPATSRA